MANRHLNATSECLNIVYCWSVGRYRCQFLGHDPKRIIVDLSAYVVKPDGDSAGNSGKRNLKILMKVSEAK